MRGIASYLETSGLLSSSARTLLGLRVINSRAGGHAASAGVGNSEKRQDAWYLVISIGVRPGALGPLLEGAKREAAYIASQTRQRLDSILAQQGVTEIDYNRDKVHVEVVEIEYGLYAEGDSGGDVGARGHTTFRGGSEHLLIPPCPPIAPDFPSASFLDAMHTSGASLPRTVTRGSASSLLKARSRVS